MTHEEMQDAISDLQSAVIDLQYQSKMLINAQLELTKSLNSLVDKVRMIV